MRGKNFLLTILRLARERDELRIVSDQIGAPTWCRMIAEATAQVVAQFSRPQGEGWAGDISDVYHLTAAGQTSWYGFTQAILKSVKFPNGPSLPRVIPISSEEYPTLAPRPKNSMLSNATIRQKFGLESPRWEMTLRLSLEERIQ